MIGLLQPRDQQWWSSNRYSALQKGRIPDHKEPSFL